MSVSNSIELYNRETKQIAVLRLYRVMWVGHLDDPDEQVEYQAVLRECIPSGQLEPGGKEKSPKEVNVIIPRRFFDIVFDAFRKDLFVLAQLFTESTKTYIKSTIMLPAPDIFDVAEYIQARKQKD